MCRPAELGIDVVVESATKYLNGHADVIAGVVAGSAEFMQKVGLTSILQASLHTATPPFYAAYASNSVLLVVWSDVGILFVALAPSCTPTFKLQKTSVDAVLMM